MLTVQFLIQLHQQVVAEAVLFIVRLMLLQMVVMVVQVVEEVLILLQTEIQEQVLQVVMVHQDKVTPVVRPLMQVQEAEVPEELVKLVQVQVQGGDAPVAAQRPKRRRPRLRAGAEAVRAGGQREAHRVRGPDGGVGRPPRRAQHRLQGVFVPRRARGAG